MSYAKQNFMCPTAEKKAKWSVTPPHLIKRITTKQNIKEDNKEYEVSKNY